MGKSAPSAPPPPDPYATARAQTDSNVSTAVANTVLGNANETSPLGTVRYQQTGSYKMSEPVLDANGAPTYTRRWVSDPTNSGANNGPDGNPVGGGSYSYMPGVGVTMAPTDGAGGHWVEEQVMSNRDIPTWERVTTLSPEQQELYDRQTATQKGLLDLALSQTGRLQQTLGQPLDFSDIPDQTQGVLARILGGEAGSIRRDLPTNDYSEDRKRVEDALYARLNPQLTQDRAALETQLLNQGFTRGTEAFNTELDSANRQANDARLGVIAAGGQEQSRLRGLDFQSFALENDAQNQAFNQLMSQLQAAGTSRDRAIQERMALRNAPINEISALLGSSQVQMPQFSPYQAGNIANTPVGDYVYKSADQAQKNYQAEVSASNSANSSMSSLLGTVGSAAIMFF